MAENGRHKVEEWLRVDALQNYRWDDHRPDPVHRLSENAALADTAVIDPDADRYGDAHIDADRRGDGYRYTDPNRYRDCYGDPHADIDTDANGYADPHADPHAHGIAGDRFR